MTNDELNRTYLLLQIVKDARLAHDSLSPLASMAMTELRKIVVAVTPPPPKTSPADLAAARAATGQDQTPHVVAVRNTVDGLPGPAEVAPDDQPDLLNNPVRKL